MRKKAKKRKIKKRKKGKAIPASFCNLISPSFHKPLLGRIPSFLSLEKTKKKKNPSHYKTMIRKKKMSPLQYYFCGFVYIRGARYCDSFYKKKRASHNSLMRMYRDPVKNTICRRVFPSTHRKPYFYCTRFSQKRTYRSLVVNLLKCSIYLTRITKNISLTLTVVTSWKVKHCLMMFC